MAQVLWNSDIDVYNRAVMPLPVARSIAWYLDIPDLQAFAQLSRNTHKAATDAELWVSRLEAMGVWRSARAHKLKSDWDALTCLDRIVKEPKVAKIQVLRIWKCLHEYYDDFSHNVAYERLKLFKHFHTPQQQARVLRNLLRYTNSDPDRNRQMETRGKVAELVEIFQSALLRELEIHYDIQDFAKTRLFIEILIGLGNDQTLVDFYLQKTSELVHVFDLELCFELDNIIDVGEAEWRISDRIREYPKSLALEFNEQLKIVDVIFPQLVAMMFKVSEKMMDLIQADLERFVETAKSRNLYLEAVPRVYHELTTHFLTALNASKNAGESYFTLVRELLDGTLESIVSEYMNDERLTFRLFCGDNLDNWKERVAKREQETTQSILKHVKVEQKNDFLHNFRKVFAINTEKKDESFKVHQAQILAENIKLLNEVFSPQLVLSILNRAKDVYRRLLQFVGFTVASVRFELQSLLQDIFMGVIEGISGEHLKVGFEKALTYLKEYNPRDVRNLIKSDSQMAIEPLVIFFELINMADMIVQMVDIFYKEEIINGKVVKNENSVLNPSLQSKKGLEALVDKYVADGLNAGIDVLFKEIESVFITYLNASDYNPPPGKLAVFDGPTQAAEKNVQILEANIDLLVDSADKAIVEVFQQEVAERFFQSIVKVLKRSTISVDGATTLIADLNLYHDFIVTHIKSNKRFVFPLYQALKNVGSLYIISGSDLKAIGHLVGDMSKFSGGFQQDEIYELVLRRLDWYQIKRDVDKVIYGLGIECTVV